jgi:hypothetical protein
MTELCILYIYLRTCVHTHTHTSLHTYPTTMCDIISYEISHAQCCICLCCDGCLCLYVLCDARFLILLLSVGPAETHLMHCSLPRLIVLNPILVPPFMSRGAPRQTA